jgi:hypothetical protein
MRSASEGGQGQRSRELLRNEIGICFMISFRPLTSDDRPPSYEAAAADLDEGQDPRTVREAGSINLSQLAPGDVSGVRDRAPARTRQDGRGVTLEPAGAPGASGTYDGHGPGPTGTKSDPNAIAQPEKRDGGHEKVPVGGHENSPRTATRSPQVWPPNSPL